MNKSRKTHTSSEVKDRWNRAHYDRVGIYVPRGAGAELRTIAAAKGMSVAAYIRHLVIADNAENPDSTYNLRGGGYADSYTGRIAADCAARYAAMIRDTVDGVHPDQMPLN